MWVSREVGGDQEEMEGLADAAHAVDGELAFDVHGAFGGEVLAEFGEELIAAFEQGPEGGGEMKTRNLRSVLMMSAGSVLES